MIDYEKLKESLAIAREYKKTVNGQVEISITFENIEGKPIYQLRHYELKKGFQIIEHIKHSFWDIDDLITKLKDLTKPKPKYEVGQMVYWTFDGLVYCGIIYYFFPNENRYQIKIEEHWINLNQSQLYPSREALIDAQIEYWHSLKEPVNPEDMRPEFEGEVKGFNHCEHDYDALRDDCGYKFLRHINGTSYYVSHKDNGVYCGCGVPADYAHRCKCRKCGAVKITHSRCKKCGELYR